MIPEGWEVYSFSDIASFKNGLNFNSNVEGGVPIKIVGVGDFKDRSSLSSFDGLQEVFVRGGVKDEFLLKGGDILFVRSNGNKDLIGRCLYFSEVDERVSFSGFTIRARFDSDYVLPEYAANLSRSSVVTRRFSEEGGGTNISNLSQPILGGVRVPIPPIVEQREIIRTLSAWDEAISAMERLIVVETNKKKSLMQQLIGGKRRLPGFDGEWESFSLKDLFYKVVRPVEWNDSNKYKLISVRRRSGGVFLRDVLFGRDIKTKNLGLVKSGDFVISKMQVVHGALAKVGSEHDGCYASGSYIILRPRDESRISVDFFEWASKTKEFYHKAYLSSYGVHIEKMTFNFDLFMKEKVFIPCDLREQKAIAKVLSTADAEIEALQQRLDCLRQEKRALMQQLLTGKRRVKVEEEAVA